MARLRNRGAPRRSPKSFLLARLRPFVARLRPFLARLRRGGVARLAAAPAMERLAGRLHRAASNLAEVTSEVSAYADLLEEKAGDLHHRTKSRHTP
ncbi:hypothetical protein HII36_54425 [Nonomuraea sp. NN258]|uniref:hypothetical protein n=1 Tax=Nonomuraea antri TaxID=2730852 RepID=UPI001567E3F3|nr:hypothetical protein [Nonomuraea antri]NRQ40748.1 hypothetical protein [Nonomuraea antri]